MKFRKRGEQGAAPRMPVHDPYALPTDLALCLESVTVVERSADDNGPRVIVQLDGCGGWLHSHDETRSQLLRRWPALTAGQLQRALRHIGAKVRQATTPAPAARRNWALNW
jgi:hypothetical protein